MTDPATDNSLSLEAILNIPNGREFLQRLVTVQAAKHVKTTGTCLTLGSIVHVPLHDAIQLKLLKAKMGDYLQTDKNRAACLRQVLLGLSTQNVRCIELYRDDVKRAMRIMLVAVQAQLTDEESLDYGNMLVKLLLAVQ